MGSMKGKWCHLLFDRCLWSVQKERMFHNHLIYIVLVACIPTAVSTIRIKSIKSYGAASTNAGKNCLAIMSKYYFHSKMLTRTKNMIMAYAHNMTLPAEIIQRKYLLWVHEAILEGELLE